jgi:SNF2 family DNA or RNA helicase
LNDLASLVPLGTRVEGPAIPAALEAVDYLAAHGLERRFPELIQRQHRRARETGPAELDLRHEATGRRPRFVLRPQYWAGESVLSHSDMARVVEEGDGWIRREDVWLRLNVEAFREVEKAAERAGLSREEDAFFVPPEARPLDPSLFAKAGELHSITPEAKGAGVALSVDLTPDERLTGRFHLVLDDGSLIEPTVSFAELAADEGWACVHGGLVQVQLPPAEMHDRLSQLASDTGLTGDDVPRCFEAIQNASGSFRDIDWRGETRRLTVRRGETACQLAVSGDHDHICIEPELVFASHGAFDDADAVRQSDLEAIQPGQTVFKRTRSGWLAAQPEIVERFQRFVEAAKRLVPVGERLEGIAIPRAMERIVPGASGRATLELHYGLRTVRIPSAIEATHRLINESAQTRYSLEIAAENGRPVCTLLPTYVHGHARLSHQDALRCAGTRDERARTEQGWVLIDPTAVQAITERARVLRLHPSERGYLVPISERERIHQAFGQIGQGSISYVKAKQADLIVDLDLDDDDALRVETQLITEDGRAIPRPTDLVTLHEDDRWMAVGNELFRIPTSDSDLDTDILEQTAPIHLSGQDVPAFLGRITEGATRAFRLRKNRRLDGLSIIQGVAQPSLRVSGDPLGIQIDPLLRVETQSGEMHDIPDEATTTLPTDRHGYARVREGWVEIHRSALKRYRAARQSLRQTVPQGERIVGPNVPEVLRTLRQIETDQRLAGPWNVYYSEDAKEKHELVEVEARVAFQMNIVEADGQSLLHLDPTYNHKRFKFTHQEIGQLTESGQTWARRGSSWIEVDSKAFRRVEKQAKELGLPRVGDGFSFPAATRERVLPLFSAIGSVEHSKAYADFVARLADFTQIEELPTPGNLRPDVALRTYQQHGFNWLGFMQRFGLNGILADDMGLGKTIQTLAAIEHARERSGSSAPVLIICPTSVVHNWRSEIGKFLVQSEVVVFQGATRDRAARDVERMADRSVGGWGQTYVVTSYDIAMREKHRLSAVPWLYVVVDEGHHIKNPSAQRTHAVKTIPGQHKLVLTGTPIQNSLIELWSLFDFTMPGFLGTRSEFGKEFAATSGVNWEKVREKLTSRIRPFVMRRLKKDVARDLPDKLTIDHEVELTPLQVALYKQVLASEDYRTMLREIDAKGVGRSQTHLFGILQRLRGVCNHPVLATDDWSLEDVRAEDSAKLDYLEELLKEVVEGDHRALLFCRSTQMHTILTKFLDQWKIDYLQLSGETPTEERHRLVEKFNSTKDIPVFLLSMAGSSGINLTSADTVIFYDHDWNPANDSQAMDRAYRIGQTKNVTVYRLISKGTIEERILERQRAKQTLADDVIGTDAAGFKDLSKEELLGLFSLGGDNRDDPRS